MASLFSNFTPFQKLFIQKYRDAMKIKLLTRHMSAVTCVPDFLCIYDTGLKEYHRPSVSNKIMGNTLFTDYCGIRNMSRYTRFSQNSGIFFNQMSRKRFKSKSVQFTDKVKDKIQDAKMKTKKRVEKMQEMVCGSNGIIFNQMSRKRLKCKSVLLTDKVKDKFQNARIKTRKRVQKIQEMKENILTVPNGLCLFRMVATPVIGYFVITEFYTASLSLFVLAGFTDCIDGYIARNFPNQQTMIGSFLDPAADKLLISTLFVTLTINGLIPVPLTSLIIFRDACLMGAGFYIRYVSLPPPKTLSRYFDMSFVTARLSPTTISKVNTVIQLSLVAASLAAPVFNFIDHMCLQMLWYVTGTTTVLSAASYLYLNHSTYKLFSVSEDKDDKK